MEQKSELTLTVNGEAVSRTVPVRRTLGDFLRDDLAFTGLKLGCEHGVCGACTVWVEGAPIRSCLMLAIQCQGVEVTTVEGLAKSEDFGILAQSFTDNHGVQCGFCTPGMLMTASAFLKANPKPSEAEIRTAISANICRCTGYKGIVDSVKTAAERLAAGKAGAGRAQGRA
ncbi:MAG TPA: (2Fe-2S)-binding protein [Candidatus Dormibacteraeota bacterium]